MKSKITNWNIFLALLLILSSCSTETENDFAKYVDPFIGTDGHGHTYPGATLPFGMVQLSPDTRIINWDACSGYHSSDDTIIGFSHTHLSGTGAIDYGDVLFMPTMGNIAKLHKERENFSSPFSHDTEIAEPGYYAVNLEDFDIDVELTTTQRTGFHKYIFRHAGDAHVVVDLKHDLGANKILASGMNIVSENEVEGYRQTEGWANNQHVYFVARFSKPFENYKIIVNDEILRNQNNVDGENVKAYLSFKVKKDEEILVKVGLSAVSIERARINMEYENLGWDFEKTKNDARQIWNKALGSIKIQDNNSINKTIFYTALYHSLLAPNIYNDVNGAYRGMDQLIHNTNRSIYTVFSLWDTFRAEHPLFSILNPELANDMVRTLLEKYNESGLLPVWELGACETNCMIGYHSIPVIADAYFKGIRDFDIELAYTAMKKSAMEDRLGLEYYKSQGFIPADLEHEAVSKNLEYAYDDWCIAKVAKDLGKEEDYKYFINRAQFYKNTFDTETGFMRGKKNGKFVTPFDPSEVSGDYTEANAWQYSYFVPHDVSGLINLLGGNENFIKKLDALFTADESLLGRGQPDISGMIGQYAHGNEPSHHMAYLYNFAGAPWKTQEITNRIMTELYTAERDGLCGNEDCGQMSAWYVFSAMGFYPVTPAMDYYVIGTPLFKNITISLTNGKSFSIEANNISEANIYIQSVKLNDKELNRSFIYHNEIMHGGTLVFEMGNTPNKEWGSKSEDMPVSQITNTDFVVVPEFIKSEKIFTEKSLIEIKNNGESKIYYTLNGKNPTQKSKLYTNPIEISKTIILKAIAINSNGTTSMIVETKHTKIPAGRSIKLSSEYEHIYSAGGDMALIDMQRGSIDFRSGAWQGYQGINLEAIIDLGKVQKINKLGLGCLQDWDKWIFLPAKVEFWGSVDGSNYTEICEIENTISTKKGGSFIHVLSKEITNTKTRFIKMIATNIGECPDWHRAAGGKSWIFVDEVVIK